MVDLPDRQPTILNPNMILSKAKAFGELGNNNVENSFMFEEQKSIMIDDEDNMMGASLIYDSQQFINLMKEAAAPAKKELLQPIQEQIPIISRKGTVMVRVADSDSSSEEELILIASP